MFSRFRTAVGLALLLALSTSITVSAKSSFAFISITGPELKEAVRLSDPTLTADFFTFADFFRDGTEAPVDPGIGYEITRYYVEGSRETAFDKLHYYPDTGFVYYDGIVNGSSEYDGKWYTARPNLKTIFESALYTELRLIGLRNNDATKAMVPPPQTVDVIDPARSSRAFTQPQLVISVAIMASLVMILVLAFWRRRPSVHS
jgi:hypothetical protein